LQIVRITAPTVKDAANLKNIVGELRKRGCHVPIIADIHFKPDAAMEAAKWVEMVRVNLATTRLRNSRSRNIPTSNTPRS
jgi:(E)-4-hydroxy-3-methylbut-2-enyl-diphosphate synthase